MLNVIFLHDGERRDAPMFQADLVFRKNKSGKFNIAKNRNAEFAENIDITDIMMIIEEQLRKK